MPDTKAREVTFRVWVDTADKLPKSLKIRASVRPAANAGAKPTEVAVTVSQFDKPLDIKVPMTNALLWTPQTPHLYVAEFRASAGKVLCDKVRFRFGMRDIVVEDGHYRLNGRPLWFRGSNLVKPWHLGDTFNRQVKRYIVDEARAMNLNSFRTHTSPPPTSWVNVADEHGIMILAEMPVLHNYMGYNLTPEEYKIWRKNVLIDAPGWITKLWNHPSIVMWVLSNETLDNKWEGGPYRDMVVKLDPTRPTMRTGARGDPRGTKENLDLHLCANIAKGPEGWIIQKINQEAAKKDPTRTLTNTEYMNMFGGWEHVTLLWTGKPRHPRIRQILADAAAEHTEAMRRVQLDGIFPYMYRGWTGLRGNNWRADYPTPMAAALHSSMAPVLASLELFDRNFVVGRQVVTPLHLINELDKDVSGRIDAYITPRNPLVVPDADALKAAIWHESFRRTFKAGTITVEDLRWEVPDKAGSYYLAVVVTRKGERAVVSQRLVRAVVKADTKAALRGKRITVLGASASVEKWMRSNDAEYSAALGDSAIDADAVVVWDANRLGDRPAAARAILAYVRSGGKLVILNHSKWVWAELVDFQVTRHRDWINGVSSRVFPYEGVKHPMLSGVNPECLKRWNGLPGTISADWIKGDILAKGTKILWKDKPERTVAFSLPMGRGEIVICLMHLKERIAPGAKRYDPVAERVFLNLLAQPVGSANRSGQALR